MSILNPDSGQNQLSDTVNKCPQQNACVFSAFRDHSQRIFSTSDFALISAQSVRHTCRTVRTVLVPSSCSVSLVRARAQAAAAACADTRRCRTARASPHCSTPDDAARVSRRDQPPMSAMDHHFYVLKKDFFEVRTMPSQSPLNTANPAPRPDD